MNAKPDPLPQPNRWFGRTVLNLALASLPSGWSHDVPTGVLPAFLATTGLAAGGGAFLVEH